jgi:hypothetical protein
VHVNNVRVNTCSSCINSCDSGPGLYHPTSSIEYVQDTLPLLTCIDSSVPLIECILSPFHYAAYLIPNGLILQASLLGDSSLSCSYIQNDYVFRITVYYDICVVSNHQDLTPLFDLA